MSQLKPSRIVLHCGLHKTGSTYIQRNLQTDRELLTYKIAEVIKQDRQTKQ